MLLCLCTSHGVVDIGSLKNFLIDLLLICENLNETQMALYIVLETFKFILCPIFILLDQCYIHFLDQICRTSTISS